MSELSHYRLSIVVETSTELARTLGLREGLSRIHSRLTALVQSDPELVALAQAAGLSLALAGLPELSDEESEDAENEEELLI